MLLQFDLWWLNGVPSHAIHHTVPCQKMNEFVVEWLYKDSTSTLTLSGSLVAGSLAGFSAKIVTYPMDITRKRMQMQGFQEARVGYGKVSSFLSTLSHQSIYIFTITKGYRDTD